MRPFPLLMLCLSACWPMISEPFSEDTDPDTDPDTSDGTLPSDAVLLGEFSWTELRGSYWESAVDGDAGGAFLWWGIYEGGPAHTWDRLGTMGSCERNPATPGWLGGGTEPLEGASTTTVSGPLGELTMFWQSTTNLYTYTVDPPDDVNGTWSIDSLETKYGTLAVASAATLSSNIRMTSPDVDGSTPPFLSEGQLSIVWTGGNADNVYVINITTVDEDNVTVEQVSCIQQGGNSKSVPSNLFQNWPAAIGGYLDLGVYQESSGPVQGSNGVNHLSGVHWQRGFFYAN